MLCATLPAIPLASSSDREARKMRRGRPELAEQLVGLARPQTGNQPQGEPVQFIFFSKGRRQHGIFK